MITVGTSTKDLVSRLNKALIDYGIGGELEIINKKEDLINLLQKVRNLARDPQVRAELGAAGAVTAVVKYFPSSIFVTNEDRLKVGFAALEAAINLACDSPTNKALFPNSCLKQLVEYLEPIPPAAEEVCEPSISRNCVLLLEYRELSAWTAACIANGGGPASTTMAASGVFGILDRAIAPTAMKNLLELALSDSEDDTARKLSVSFLSALIDLVKNLVVFSPSLRTSAVAEGTLIENIAKVAVMQHNQIPQTLKINAGTTLLKLSCGPNDDGGLAQELFSRRGYREATEMVAVHFQTQAARFRTNMNRNNGERTVVIPGVARALGIKNTNAACIPIPRKK